MGTSIGLGSLSAQSSVLQSSEDRLIQGANLPKGPTDAAKIDKGSKEFEAVLVGSWLQQAEQSFAPFRAPMTTGSGCGPRLYDELGGTDFGNLHGCFRRDRDR